MSYQIIGDDGSIHGPDEAQLLALQSAYQNGSLPGDAFVGAAGDIMPGLIMRMTDDRRGGSARSTVSPAVLAGVISAMTAAARRPGAPMMNPTNARVVNAVPGPLREVVQGLASASVAPGASAELTFNATMEFRPSRLMIGDSIASLFIINDIKVGSDSLFLAAGAVPGEVFGLNSQGSSALKRRSAAAGTPITISITNIDGAAHVFRGALFGEGVDISQCRV